MESRAEHNGLAGRRLKPLGQGVFIYFEISTAGNRTPGFAATGRGATNSTKREIHFDLKNIYINLQRCHGGVGMKILILAFGINKY